MKKFILLVGLTAFWLLFVYIASATEKDKNATVRFLGYLALIVVSIFEFWVILNLYFGIKLSELIL